MSSTLLFRQRLMAVLATGSVAAACGGNASDGDLFGPAGAGGQAGSAGSSAGAGGSNAGAGGSNAGTGGTGGSTAGAGGSNAGAGGSTAGAGGGGTGGIGGCEDSPVPPGGTGGTGSGCFSPLLYDNCYSLAQLRELLRECAAPLGDGQCPPIRDLIGPYANWQNACTYFTKGPWRDTGMCCYTVSEEGGDIGRPFMCGGELRRAGTCARGDWASPSNEPAERLDDATRAALAAAWLEDARLEHASIASFARLTLQLLERGAPPELVALSQAASIDEVEHAKLSFALASRYGDRPIGPSLLSMKDALSSVSLAELAASTVVEGCIGETLAAIVAREQLARAGDPDVRSALEQIADDESRHAELAWRLVKWAIDTGGAGVRDAVRRAFETHARIGKIVPDPEGIERVAWRAHGRLTARETEAVQRAALDDVVLPCATALVGKSAADGVLQPAI